MMNRFSKYSKPTIELVLSLLAEAYDKEAQLDKILERISDEVFAEIKEELEKMIRDGKIDLDKKVNLHNRPAIYTALKRIEQKEWNKLMEYTWIGMQVISESMAQTYQQTMAKTFEMFNYVKAMDTVGGPKSLNITVQTTDTYIKENVLKIPWCQDGKTYSERLYSNVANFHSKLAYVLEEGITNGRGMDWMQQAWRKLTGSAAYDTARLLKTETMAMWSLATKQAYLEMGIEYVEVIGDAECGGICLDYLDSPIPLAEAELGDLLPPYHPNCACCYVAYTENVDVPIDGLGDFD